MSAYIIPTWAIAKRIRERMERDGDYYEERCYCGQCEAPGTCPLVPRPRRTS